MIRLVKGSLPLGLWEELAGSWSHQGLSAADPGSAVTAALIVQGCKIMQKGTRIVHVHFTCLKQVGSLLLGFILYTN